MSSTNNVYQAPFYVPPRVTTPFAGGMSQGEIILYKDNNWNSAKLVIKLGNSPYIEDNVFSFAGTNLQDGATWIAFCLPVGTVCTLFDNAISSDPANPYNFSGAGICVDLIGNGQIQTIDLAAYGANDMLSGGIWRQVTTSEGWFQLFTDTGCSGQFNTIFLDEWPTGTVNSLQNWYINDKASSINCPCLTPVQTLTLSENTNGSGSTVTYGAANAFGSFTQSGAFDLTGPGMNDRVSAFSCTVIQPQQAKIASVSAKVQGAITDGNTFSTSATADNRASTSIPITMQLAESQSCTVSSTTTMEYSMSVSVTASVAVSAGVPGEDGVTATLSTTLSTGITSTTSKSFSATQTFDLSQTVTFTAPPQSHYTAVATVAIGEFPTTTVTTTGKFYYKQNLKGSTFDSTTGLYVLSSPVTVNLAGGFGSQVSIEASAAPLG